MDEFARSTLRLAHPGVIDPQQRMVHARFLRIAFAMPALAPLVAMTIPGADVASVLAWTCAAMAISWGGALLALVRGRIAAPTVIVILAFATGLAAAMTLGGSSFQAHAVNGFASGGSEHYAENSPPVRDGKRLDHGYGW